MIKAIFKFIRDAIWLCLATALAIAFGMAIGGGAQAIAEIVRRLF